jgi:hypothetical protein
MKGCLRTSSSGRRSSGFGAKRRDIKSAANGEKLLKSLKKTTIQSYFLTDQKICLNER